MTDEETAAAEAENRWQLGAPDPERWPEQQAPPADWDPALAGLSEPVARRVREQVAEARDFGRQRRRHLQTRAVITTEDYLREQHARRILSDLEYEVAQELLHDSLPSCYRCGEPVMDHQAQAEIVADLDPGNPEVGPQPDVQSVVVHSDCLTAEDRRQLDG